MWHAVGVAYLVMHRIIIAAHVTALVYFVWERQTGDGGPGLAADGRGKSSSVMPLPQRPGIFSASPAHS